MYFQIENTPEHLRKARRVDNAPKESPKEECPRLILAPFSRPPQVVFDNVLIGSSCDRSLEVLNPSKHLQQITLGKALPPGLVIHLPGEWLELDPETCYCLTMTWTPTQPTAMRETIRFTNESRGRYDVIVVLKSVMNIKGKNQHKGFKTSPGKIKKKGASKKSPVQIYKKKSEIIYNTTKVEKTVNVVQSTQKVYHTHNKENVADLNDYSNKSYHNKCPFDSPSSIDMNFNTSEIFSDMRKTNILQETYDKSYNIMNSKVDETTYDRSYNCMNNRADVVSNVLKPSNKQICEKSATDIFDNLTFTPMKRLPAKSDKLDKGPKIMISVNSESDFDDSLDLKAANKENQTHSIISITSSQPPNKWLTVNHEHLENQYVETPTIQNKKQPNTSSPKEFNSPNFSINTDFSRISDLSFFPQRFSTERKCFPKINETHEMLDDKLSSDTFTKDSPNIPVERNDYPMHIEKPPHYFNRDQPKMCRQSLFREYQMQKDAYDKNYLNVNEHNFWQNDLRVDYRSPPRSITPPLQSIPEESTQFSETQVLDKTDKQMATFTINRTFDKAQERSSMSTSTRQTWSKKAIRAEPDLWKVPIAHIKKSSKAKAAAQHKESIGSKMTNATFESNKTINQNLTINQIGNIYSQSSTIDPFLSTTYFYDEEAVDKFEKEFKRWLNCILTPPADLDSNVEQKIDVGKAWIENRNKEVPLAPTKEQVSCAYHNSHRLESLRRAARSLLMSPDMVQVYQKLNAQIEKKLIAIRTDRNLHLDVGLQKIIMELLLSYNPLWLRMGLEAIYGQILPLKSNSDIEGLTTFIIHRMFKNPHLKNKHSKSNAPNMLLPAYMEAIKKFTLKKFFMLVYFLDQAKQRKLIPHDPCLFCRNAICKESREIIIRFTREVIAGIGDITRHLRPLGYVVSHKQSYLDEYKYAVHNIALDIRDGVRLTKVMEIIMMKDGLLKQLRTPAISRLQKIHNVDVALNALKEANFVIHGDIAAVDIADGHREKTLSLLWQIIHEYRAPLFEKAANVIQTWWRKKYEVIVEIRKEQERERMRLINAASVIQCWWRRIQYSHEVEWRLQQITRATIVVQKYCRMWLCRTRLKRFKSSVILIEEWFRSIKVMREAKQTLQRLRAEREELRRKSATKIQSYVRRWIRMKHYKITIRKIVQVQSLVRRFVVRRQYSKVKKSVLCIQKRYRGKLLMRKERQKFAEQRKSAIVIQSYVRMIKQRWSFLNLKKAVAIIEERYVALIKMRNERNGYVKLRKNVIAMQTLFRCRKCRNDYLRQKKSIVLLQKKFRAYLLMKKDKAAYLKIKNATIVLQKYIRSYFIMKKLRLAYITRRQSAICIQQYYRSYLLTKSQRHNYVQLRNASIVLQKRYRGLLLMRKERSAYLKLRTAAVSIQRLYRAQVEMRKCKEKYMKLQSATLAVQRRYRALMQMREQRRQYLKSKSSCVKIQNAYRSYVLGKHQRQNFLKQKQAAIIIQNWFRSCKKGKEAQQQYQEIKQACATIQRHYKAFIISRKTRQEYIRVRTATICIQKFYRSYIEMRTVRQQYIQIKTCTVKIQQYYRSHLETKKQRVVYLKMKSAVSCIENVYKRFKEYQMIRQRYLTLRETVINVQRRYRSILVMRAKRNEFLRLKQSTVTVQQQYRALLVMRKERRSYISLRTAVVKVQARFRAQRLMKQERLKYETILKATILIQRLHRAYVSGSKQRQAYLKLKESAIVIQRRYKALLAMRQERSLYLAKKKDVVNIQRRFRANKLMLKDRGEYLKTLRACKAIQRYYRAYHVGKKQRNEYIMIKTSAIFIQTWFRMLMETRIVRTHYLQLRMCVILIQRRFRANTLARSIRQNEAATKIQTWYISVQKSNLCRKEFVQYRKHVIVIQSIIRMHILRKKFLEIKRATITIQRYYESYKLAAMERQRYIQVRRSIIKLQSYVRSYIARKRYLRLRSAVLTIQAVYRLKRHRDLIRGQRETAAICLQKYIRRYLVQSWYRKYQQKTLHIQRIWRGKLLTRLIRCDYLQKRWIVIKLQSVARGYLVRKQVHFKKEHILKIRQEQRRHWAASKIQALFRGHKARVLISHDARVAELRRRWREGALQSTQESLKERNEEAMWVLKNMSDIETVIRAFRSLELSTEVYPMTFDSSASSLVRRLFVYMSVTNRSISSIEVLKSAAAVLVNLTRYRVTGPNIYSRDRVAPILKFMWRFSNSETHLFCILCTHLWLFSKYDKAREDLTQFLQIPENHKMLVTIKQNVDRMKRMANNARNKYFTPQSVKFISHTQNRSSIANQSLSQSRCNLSAVNQSMTSACRANSSILLPALEPDYGIVRVDKPKYFEDPEQAIHCLFHSYNL